MNKERKIRVLDSDPPLESSRDDDVLSSLEWIPIPEKKVKVKRTISVIRKEISYLEDYDCLCRTRRVMDLIGQIRKENKPKIDLLKNKPKIDLLKKELEEFESKKRPSKPRWPEDTPKEVIAFCKDYWKGTTEYDSFRIHCWNEKAVWTSYPSGGYSTAGGWNPTPAGFHLLSFTGKAIGGGAEILEDLEGRVSLKQMNEILKTKGV